MGVPAASTGVLAGVDVGGTSIAVRLATPDLHDLGRHALPTERGAPDRAGAQVVAAIDAACAALGVDPAAVAAIGIGVPGHVDPVAGTVRMAVNLGWDALPLRAQVQALRPLPVGLDNDVRGAAEGVRARRLLGEVRDFVYVAVGTGIAAGIVLDDRVLHGTHLFAGEIGHIVVEEGGPRCNCGQHGCLEAIAGGPAVAALARAAIEAGAASTLADHAALGAAEVYAASMAGDAVARAAVARAARALARTFAVVDAVLDIPCIAIGGGVASAGAAFFGPLEDALDAIRATSPFAATILPRDLIRPLPAGDDAGTWGAVLLARAAANVG
ncbi:MAG: ROK family protein [Chloroflexota bacterium]